MLLLLLVLVVLYRASSLGDLTWFFTLCPTQGAQGAVRQSGFKELQSVPINEPLLLALFPPLVDDPCGSDSSSSVDPLGPPRLSIDRLLLPLLPDDDDDEGKYCCEDSRQRQTNTSPVGVSRIVSERFMAIRHLLDNADGDGGGNLP